ncbi:MAG: MBL fold metallo-hydrolase [Candidatus Lindowbacteria bacterium]|nr:MBL fold metallo-hydrolase [Candidatus Lindowbacteria bacterium]
MNGPKHPKAMHGTTPKIRGNEVTFLLDDQDAGMVNVLGTFNHWNLTDGVMERDSKGVWRRTETVLLRGSYDYKYIVDGEWILDPANPDYGKDYRGRYNSRFLVTTSAAAVDHLRSAMADLKAFPPGSNARERLEIFLRLDRILQLPTAAHSRILKNHYIDRLEELTKKLKNRKGQFVANAYCHGFVLQSGGKNIAIDVVSTRTVWGVYWDVPSKTVEHLADELDALFVSHLHPDHMDPLLINLLVARNVPVFVPGGTEDRFPDGVIPMWSDQEYYLDGWDITFHDGCHVYDEREMLILRYLEFLTPNDKRIVHTTDHDYTRGIRTNGPVDVLIAKTNGINPNVDGNVAFQNLLLHVKPKQYILGHLNELGHDIKGGREPYETACKYVLGSRNPNGDCLHWAESWDF